MPIAIDTKRRFDYTLETEREEDGRPKEGATTFVLRALTYSERGEFAQKLREAGATEHSLSPYSPAARFVLERGIVGWRRFKMEDGTEVPHALTSEGVLSEDSLSALGTYPAMELFTEIGFRLSHLTKEQRD